MILQSLKKVGKTTHTQYIYRWKLGFRKDTAAEVYFRYQVENGKLESNNNNNTNRLYR